MLVRYGNESVVAADFELPLRNLRLTMLEAPDTTVVVGKGLGPDLLVPVPFVMARRRGREAHFVSLLEPYGDAPRVSLLQEIAPNSFRVVGQDFEDSFTITAQGRLDYVRRTTAARNLNGGRPPAGQDRDHKRTVQP